MRVGLDALAKAMVVRVMGSRRSYFCSTFAMAWPGARERVARSQRTFVAPVLALRLPPTKRIPEPSACLVR